MGKTRGQINYEAFSPPGAHWEAVEPRYQALWEAGAEAVRNTAIIECLQVIKDIADSNEGFGHDTSALRSAEENVRNLMR